MQADQHFFLVHSSIRKHPIWTADKKFTKGQALIDLMARGDSFDINLRFLAKEWAWHILKVSYFIKLLESYNYMLVSKLGGLNYKITFRNEKLPFFEINQRKTSDAVKREIIDEYYQPSGE